MKRRAFVKKTALGSTSLMVPAFLRGIGQGDVMQYKGKKLVVIQLSGGNDGLNTVVPYRNDHYYKLRPSLALKPNEVLPISDELGLHQALKPIRELFDDGLLTILNSVGYPNPNRSHFRSMDIWQTGSRSNEYLQTGWIGRYLDSHCTDAHPPYHAIEVDDSLSFALKGKNRKGFAMSNPRKMNKVNENEFLNQLGQHGHQHEDDQMSYLYKTMIDTQSSADYLKSQARIYTTNISYPDTSFGRDLKTVAELMVAGTETEIYYVSLGGFDTHANQKVKQGRLLGQYADGVNAFVKDLKKNKLLNDTLVLTFSEFGRRVIQNGSNGTDHGTANNVFLISGDLKRKGFYNEGPDLTDLDNGDLKYKVDFRNIYANVIDQWLGANPELILGAQFKSLGIV